jgi:hypothetical protein
MVLIALLATLLASQPIKLDSGQFPIMQAFERKRAMGTAAFAAEVGATIGQLRDRATATGHCPSPTEAASAARLELVRRTSDLQAWTKSETAAEAALAQRRELRALYLDGAPASRPYGLVSRMAARAKAEPDPRLAALYRRMAEDQFSRIDSIALKPFFGPGVHTTWEKGLEEAELAYVAATIESEWCANGVANAEWLKADLRAHGWYRISTYGADADRAAWSIAQHAQHDLAFREEVLAMLEPLWLVGETKGENYAALYDDTAAARGRPARFGLIGECTAPGGWTPGPQENPAATDAWRAKAGMPPLSEEIAARSRACSG